MTSRLNARQSVFAIEAKRALELADIYAGSEQHEFARIYYDLYDAFALEAGVHVDHLAKRDEASRLYRVRRFRRQSEEATQ